MNQNQTSRSFLQRLGGAWNWLNEGAHGEAFRITLLCTLAGTMGGACTGLGAFFGFGLALGICVVMFTTIFLLFKLGEFINKLL